MSYNYSRSPLYTQQQLAFSLDYILYGHAHGINTIKYMYTAQIVLGRKEFL